MVLNLQGDRLHQMRQLQQICSCVNPLHVAMQGCWCSNRTRACQVALTMAPWEALLSLTKEPFLAKLPILLMLPRDMERRLDRPTMEGAGPPLRGRTVMTSPSLMSICSMVFLAVERVICTQATSATLGGTSLPADRHALLWQAHSVCCCKRSAQPCHHCLRVAQLLHGLQVSPAAVPVLCRALALSSEC